MSTRREDDRDGDGDGRADELVGLEAIRGHMASMGLPCTARAVERWARLPGRRRAPLRTELREGRLAVVCSRRRLESWVRRMDADGYAGFSKIRAREERRAPSEQQSPQL